MGQAPIFAARVQPGDGRWHQGPSPGCTRATNSAEHPQGMRMRGPRAHEERFDVGARHVFDATRIPSWRLVLVHGKRANSVDGLAGWAGSQIEAMSDDVALHAQVVG